MPNLTAGPEVFVKGFEAPEGPSFNRQGHLFFVDFRAGRIYRVAPDRQVEVFVEGGIPTGTKFHRDGRLLVCDGARGLIAVEPDGQVSVLADEYAGQPLHGPNDLTISPQGDVYFTDPRGSSLDSPTGDVYLYRADGSLELLDGGYALCNGIAVGPGGQTLYMSETYTWRIYRFALGDDGRFAGREIFAQLEGGLGPDGMAFDVEGNLYVAHWGKGCVAVLAPDGVLLGELPTGGMKPSNLAFWEEAIYVTEVEQGQVVRLQVGVPGMELYG
jgi:gluconolactonase